MPGGSSSRVLSRIQDHNKSPDRACSSRADDEERAQSEPSSNKRKKSSSSSSSNRKSAEKRGAVGGALQEQVKDPQSDLAKGGVLVQVHQQQWYNQQERILQNGSNLYFLLKKLPMLGWKN